MTFDTRLAVESIDSTTWVLLEDLVYTGSKGDTIIVPAGAETDFASVPNWLQSFTPRTGAWTKAAVVHDMLCRELNLWHRAQQAKLRGRVDLVDSLRTVQRPKINAVDTDGIFRLIMKESKVSGPRQWLMWTGVRWGALANPARRAGWLAPKQSLPTLGISAAVLATLVATAALVARIVPW